jgi:hypothetical protein
MSQATCRRVVDAHDGDALGGYPVQHSRARRLTGAADAARRLVPAEPREVRRLGLITPWPRCWGGRRQLQLQGAVSGFIRSRLLQAGRQPVLGPPLPPPIPEPDDYTEAAKGSADHMRRQRGPVIPELHPITCGYAVGKPVDNHCQVRINARFLWISCG